MNYNRFEPFVIHLNLVKDEETKVFNRLLFNVPLKMTGN